MEWLFVLTPALTVLAVLVSNAWIKKAVEAVQHEVKTANGVTVAALSDLAEGRRIRADVPEETRTRSEREFVRNLEDTEEK